VVGLAQVREEVLENRVAPYFESGSPTENYDISASRYLQWLSGGKFPSYENGPGCTSWGPGIAETFGWVGSPCGFAWV